MLPIHQGMQTRLRSLKPQLSLRQLSVAVATAMVLATIGGPVGFALTMYYVVASGAIIGDYEEEEEREGFSD